MHDWEEDFRVRVGRPRDPGAGSAGRPLRVTPSRLARRGRGGRVMADVRGRTAGVAGLRRVVVKARIVRMTAGSGALRAHLAYLERDARGVGVERGLLYSADEDHADGRRFLDRSERDRHQFRFIISPEEGRDLDLRGFTRELMTRMEDDLGARLEWVAVDHADTAHPHTHVIIRGKTDRRADLLISQDYITEGLRLRARELATEHLGPRLEREVRARQVKEIDLERFTALDRSLLRGAHEGIFELRSFRGAEEGLQSARLHALERMGLARQPFEGIWKLSPDLESELRWRGEQGDIIKAMNRVLARQGQRRDVASLVTRDGELEPMVGRILDKGLAGPTEERAALFVDGIDGKVRRIEVSLQAASQLALGSIVQTGVGATRADHTIAELSGEGRVYRTLEHQRQLEMGDLAKPEGVAARDIVASHVRRLEALRRARIVDRYEEGRWRIPEDFLDKAAAYEQRRGVVRVLSRLDLDRQVQSRGATWLDRQLVAAEPLALAPSGFGAEVKRALEERTQVLEQKSLAHRQDGEVRFQPGLLQALVRAEVNEVGRAYALKTGLLRSFPEPGETVRGIYAEKLQLDSGPFALVTWDRGFALLPLREVIERSRGREVGAVIEQGLGVSWKLGRELERMRELERIRDRDLGLDRGRDFGLSR